MRSVYEIVRVYPNKSEEVIQTVDSMEEVALYVETPQYVGTWINESRKLLRYGRGEIRIRRVFDRPTIESRVVTTVFDQPAFLLGIKKDEQLKFIIISRTYIAGYSKNRMTELWKVTNFAKLPTLIDKELAYQCMVEYDMLIDTYKLKPSL